MTRSGYYYDVVKYKGHSGLCIHNNERVEDVVDEINRIVAHAREEGWNHDEKWLIVLVEWERVWDDDDVFCSSWEKRTAVALYDNGTVTDI